MQQWYTTYRAVAMGGRGGSLRPPRRNGNWKVGFLAVPEYQIFYPSKSDFYQSKFRFLKNRLFFKNKSNLLLNDWWSRILMIQNLNWWKSRLSGWAKQPNKSLVKADFFPIKIWIDKKADFLMVWLKSRLLKSLVKSDF